MPEFLSESLGVGRVLADLCPHAVGGVAGSSPDDSLGARFLPVGDNFRAKPIGELYRDIFVVLSPLMAVSLAVKAPIVDAEWANLASTDESGAGVA